MTPKNVQEMPTKRLGDTGWCEGILEIQVDDSPPYYKLTLVPVAHQATEKEIQDFKKGIPVSWSKQEATRRRVLHHEGTIDLMELLAPYAGKHLKIFFSGQEPSSFLGGRPWDELP